jgi:hypothetical protein
MAVQFLTGRAFMISSARDSMQGKEKQLLFYLALRYFKKKCYKTQESKDCVNSYCTLAYFVVPSTLVLTP